MIVLAEPILERDACDFSEKGQKKKKKKKKKEKQGNTSKNLGQNVQNSKIF